MNNPIHDEIDFAASRVSGLSEMLRLVRDEIPGACDASPASNVIETLVYAIEAEATTLLALNDKLRREEGGRAA